MTFSPIPALANIGLVQTSSLGIGVSLPGAGNWLARVTLGARQSFPNVAQIAHRLDHLSAGSIVRKFLHAVGSVMAFVRLSWREMRSAAP